MLRSNASGPELGLLVRINRDSNRESLDVGPESTPKPDETKPIMPKAAATDRHKPIPIDVGQVSWCFDHDPKLLVCEIA